MNRVGIKYRIATNNCDLWVEFAKKDGILFIEDIMED